MDKNKKTPTAKWTTPVVVDLDNTAGDVANGYAAGTDGAGGLATSMS